MVIATRTPPSTQKRESTRRGSHPAASARFGGGGSRLRVADPDGVRRETRRHSGGIDEAEQRRSTLARLPAPARLPSGAPPGAGSEPICHAPEPASGNSRTGSRASSARTISTPGSFGSAWRSTSVRPSTSMVRSSVSSSRIAVTNPGAAMALDESVTTSPIADSMRCPSSSSKVRMTTWSVGLRCRAASAAWRFPTSSTSARIRALARSTPAARSTSASRGSPSTMWIQRRVSGDRVAVSRVPAPRHDDDAFVEPVELLERPDADALEAAQDDVTVERFSHPLRVAASGRRRLGCRSPEPAAPTEAARTPMAGSSATAAARSS